ncbi:unnamed protein product [Ixodes pacificus]
MRFGHVVQFLACVAIRVVASPQDYVDTLFAGTRGPKPHCAFEMCPKPRPGVTNLHFVAHTHLDIGWTRRFQENYLLAKDILESVCGELMKNRYRMFTVTEMAFFKKWFEETNEVFKIIIRKYINEGRLELAGGGWVMNDEASTLYTDVVDQMTLGHRWINATFGPCALPRAVWQLDPFGHSKEQAALFGQMEFDGLFLGRIHYLDHDWRRVNHKAEFLWRGDDSLKQDIFTAVLPQEYKAPVSFDFTSPEGDRKTYAYSANTRTQDGFRTNQKIVMFGDDFAFYNATRWYSGMDNLMDVINSENSGFYAFYSTPGCFLRSLNAEWTTSRVSSSNDTEPVHRGDFFPYSDKPGDLWTGFYSSRPSLKYLIRRASNFLQACRQITVLANITGTAIDLLDEAVAMAQHHDAITGTCTEPVAKDFGDIVSRAYTACEKVMALGVEALITVGANRNLYPTFCHLLNQSECFASEGYEKFFVSVYNPRSGYVKAVVRFPVANSGYKVTDEDRHFVPSEIVPIQHAVLHLPGRQSDAVHELIFLTNVPPLGISTFLVERFRGATIQRQGSQPPIGQVRNKDYVLKNQWYEVTVDSMTCLLKSVVRRENGKGIEVQQNFAAYTSSHGHYLFSPESPVAVEFKDNITCRIVTTTLVHEVHQWINPWISQVIRLYVSEDYVEFDWTLGPVPLKSSQGTLYGGHDVVTRFQSNLDNAGVFFTDSNGKLTVRRVANSTGVWKPVGPSPTKGYAESVEANYYPVVSWLYLRDNATGLQMTLLPDRPQGGTGYRTGQLELMVQRRLTASDNKGLEDPLDDRGLNKKGMVIRGRHLLHLAPIQEAAVRVRAIANALVLAPVLSFSDATAPYNSDVKTRRFKGLATHLPMNVQLLTLYQDAPGRVLMRLEHMQPAVPPDELTAVNATIPIHALLSTYTVKNFREVSLTASRWKNSKFEPLRWTPSNRSALPGSEPRLDGSDAKGALNAVQLFTGEIRTFVADL